MSKMYYNGFLLPPIPTDWDSQTYPYIFLTRSGRLGYLTAVDTLGYVDTSGDTGNIYTTEEKVTINYVEWIVALNEDAALDNNDAYPGISTEAWLLQGPTYNIGIAATGGPLWSNTSLNDQNGDLFISDSAPTAINLQCGDNATWDFDNYYTLIISGTGATYDYSWEEEDYPWSLFKDQITFIQVNEGITRLGNANFHGLEKIPYVSNSHLPSTLVEIGQRCFGSCYELSSVDLPNTIEKIGDYGFAQCAFSSFVIPTNLKELGSSVFVATPLSSISAGNNQNFIVSAGALFDKDLTTIILLPQKSNHTSYIIPNSVTKIADTCFYGHNNLQEIVCSSSITEIGYAAFAYIDNLTHIIIPAGVTELKHITFSNNKKLQWIKFLSSTPCTMSGTSIELNTCSNLTRIYVPTGCVETYQTAEGWSSYSHLIHESQSTNFDLNQWIMGFTYGLTGQPLPLSAEKLILEVLNGNVLYVTKANNIVVNPKVLEVM